MTRWSLPHSLQQSWKRQADYQLGCDTESQVNETLMRVVCHNICVLVKTMYQLGIIPDFAPAGILCQSCKVIDYT